MLPTSCLKAIRGGGITCIASDGGGCGCDVAAVPSVKNNTPRRVCMQEGVVVRSN